MAHPFTHTIIRGETLDLEFRLPGEVLEDVTAFVKTDSGLDPALFTATVEMPDTIRVRSITTNFFTIGTHVMRLWVRYPSDDEQVLIEALISVRSEIDPWAEYDLILDGGQPGTVYEDEFEGGEA